jgi:preprotein translocase subunit SecD
MSRQLLIKILTVVGIILLFAYFLYPTIQFNFLMSRQDKEDLKIENPDKYEKLLQNSIKLGLDLQGGMNLVMEVDVRELLNKLARNKDERFESALKEAEKEARDSESGFLTIFVRKLQEMGVDLSRYYGTRTLRDQEEIIQYLREQSNEAVNRSLEVLRNRVDQFGVAEPTIQKQGDSRIIVELAGVTDPDRVRGIVGKTALLEFRLLKDPQAVDRIGAKINEYLMGQTSSDSVEVSQPAIEKETSDTSVVRGEELFGEIDAETGVMDTTVVDSAELARQKTFKENLFFYDPNNAEILLVPKENEARLYKVLQDPEIQKIIDEEIGDGELLVGKTTPNQTFIPVYLANKEAELTGETIEEARQQVGRSASSIGGFEVSLNFNDEGARIFSRVTGANLQKPLAIVLDDKVQSAPTIQSKIRDGRAVVTNIRSIEEAEDLAVVLRAGALPAPLKVLEERSVGPSLGRDSVNQGTYSALIGLLLVGLFMIVYYKFSGFIADVALLLNIVIILGTMSAFHATLTLPGIAGLILTIGMAVDANVLIFERIREELDKGKGVWASIENGYGRALITILDANVTTFIAAMVLYSFGTGPVRGFALVLMIGIAASMLTAIFVTRTIFELLLSKRFMKQISI